MERYKQLNLQWGTNSMADLMPTAYQLMNRPPDWASFYPDVDIAQRGDAWLGESTKPQCGTKEAIDRISFFQYLHTMIWRSIVLEDTEYRFTLADTHAYYSKHDTPEVLNSLPIQQVYDLLRDFLDHEQGTALFVNPAVLIKLIRECKLTRYFMLTHMSKVLSISEDAYQILSFLCLVGHQFTHVIPREEYAYAPPPFGIVNRYGMAFDVNPHQILESDALYPCACNEHLIFGALNQSNYLAVLPTTANLF